MSDPRARALARYAAAIRRAGPGSPAAEILRRRNAADAWFLGYAEALDRVWRALRARGRPPGETGG